MMEPVEFPDSYSPAPDLPTKDTWALTGAKDRPARIVKSLFLDPVALENNSIELYHKYERMKKEEVRYENYKISAKNKVLIVAYGTMARICQTVIDELEHEGISVGLFRPITLFPYPEKELREQILKKNVETVLTVEMSMGQMVEDVEKVVAGAKPVKFFGRTGGIVPSPEEVTEQIKALLRSHVAPRKKAVTKTATNTAAKKKASKASAKKKGR